ncbi:MAG: glycosyltransferase, partial [Thermodesulfovibrionia bacterium]|nr:glycosyltransferase [Thermodesulfovibrionia bacterium]
MGINDYLMAIGRNLYSFKARRLVSKLLDRYPVDIVHLHNIHRQMSPSILYEFKKRGIPTVMTLHEYKMICPSYIMMYRNKPCEACTNGRYFNAMKLRCVKGSFFRSALLSVEMYLHHKILDIYKNVDIFIAPSMFLKRKHEEMGFNKKIVHLPYPLDCEKFAEIVSDVEPDNDKNKITFVYFGRLFPDKGLFTLVEALRILSEHNIDNRLEVKIIGDGPIGEELREMVGKENLTCVRFTGFLKGRELYSELKRSDVVIIPSEWYENYPVSVMEAFALGKPVIGARIGGIPEMVRDGETGLTFESGNSVDLSEKIKYMVDNLHRAKEMGEAARVFIDGKVNPERHYKQLMDIYRQMLS